jgi:hypothetical protein
MIPMTKDSLTLPVTDLSSFTRALARQLLPTPPSHVALMNMLARAAGFRNLQHLRAAQTAGAKLAAYATPEVTDHTLVTRALAQFDDTGQLRQWPSRRAVQILCLWAIWARLPHTASMTERQISATLNTLHRFGDAAILRRDMVALGLLSRNTDGSDYKRLESRPPPEARALIGHLTRRIKS